MKRDPGLDTLLDLHGVIIEQERGYWVKIEAWSVPASADIPHGIRYALTLHEPYGKRIMGFDNAHRSSHRENSSMPVDIYRMTTSTGTSLIEAFLMNLWARPSCWPISSAKSTGYCTR